MGHHGGGVEGDTAVVGGVGVRDFWERHPDARQALQAWYADVKRATWKTPVDIKDVYRNASFVTNNRVVFNIKGNRYRLVVAIQYEHGIILDFGHFSGTTTCSSSIRKNHSIMASDCYGKGQKLTIIRKMAKVKLFTSALLVPIRNMIG